MQGGSDQTNTGGAVILPHPTVLAAAPSTQYLDPNFDLDAVHIPFVRFAGIKRITPEREHFAVGWHAFVCEIASDPAPIVQSKDAVSYFIAGTLRDAELVNAKLRASRLAKGQSTIGRQRSSAHIASLGPAIFLDDDGDVFAREPALHVFGAACVIYSSFSFGFTKGDAGEIGRGGRVVMLLNRSITPAEYGPIWDALNHLLGCGFDEHGRSPALCYGGHARRSADAPYKRRILDGAALDADALLDFGRSLRLPPSSITTPKANGGRRSLIEEIERSRLLGSVLPPDRYGDWFPGAAAFKRALPDDVEGAFQCFDTWSSCSRKYRGTEPTRRKFDEVSADYIGGVADPVTVDVLHWRARRRAQAVLAALYPIKWVVPQPLHKSGPWSYLEGNDLAAGIARPPEAEPTSVENVTAEDGIVALDYLGFCWSKKVLQETVAVLEIPENILNEAGRRGDERRERIALGGRTLHRWGGKDLAEDTRALRTAIIASGAKLYRVDTALVRISAPASDQATAARVRAMHKFGGQPGALGDPALHVGERVVPLLPSDSEALREIIANQIATKRRVNVGTKTAPNWQGEITSFAFKSTARIYEEPDAGVLKDLLKRALVTEVPEIRGIITAPIMPDLPCSTKPAELVGLKTDRLIAQPGFDSSAGLYLSPLGTIVEVPATPSQGDLSNAVDLLRAPFADFSFVSPGADLDPDVSRAACIYGAMLAANRRALPIAPGVALSSHGEGMSTGKTLAGEVICVIATGELPAPVSLSPDFNEQRKEIVTHLLEGDGCLFLDNIPTGTRFDVAPLASCMTSDRFKGRLLGANKQIELCTRAMVVATGNSLNLAGDLASRFLLVRLDTGLERPEDRSAAQFKISDLRPWVVEHRQELVAAVHTIVRAYLQTCRQAGGTPRPVADRRQVDGTRFGGPCEVLRDALLWAFQDLPDPFLSFRASAANSSTKAEAELTLTMLDHAIARIAGAKSAPAWAKPSLSSVKSPERVRWDRKFVFRWAGIPAHERQRRFGTTLMTEAADNEWRRFQARVQSALGRREVRAGRQRLTTTEILNNLTSDEKATIEGTAARASGKLNAIALGRWLKERVVDAPLRGFVLRSAQDREKRACFWITKAK
jgi:hypothetical protein